MQMKRDAVFFGNVLTTLSYGDTVRVKKEQGSWVEIDIPDSRDSGWVHVSALERKRIIFGASDANVATEATSGEIALAGFYTSRINFAFPPAFQREARLRIAAEWQAEDLAATRAMVEDGSLDLSGLITDVAPANEAERAYPAAFLDQDCLKMVLDWSEHS